VEGASIAIVIDMRQVVRALIGDTASRRNFCEVAIR